MKPNQRTTKVLLLMLMLSILSSSQTPINLSSETYQVKASDDSGMNYFTYVDRSAANQNYHFISSTFDEGTSTFKTVDYEVLSPNFEVKAVSQDQKCALLFDPTVGSEKFQIVDFSQGTTGLLRKSLLSASLKASKVSSGTKFSVANDCKAFQIDEEVYHNRPANAFQTPFTFTGSETNKVFSEKLEYAVSDQGIMFYNSAIGAYEYKINVTISQHKKVFSNPDAIIVLSWKYLNANSIYESTVKVYYLPKSPSESIVEKSIPEFQIQSQEPPKISVSKDRSVVALEKAYSPNWTVKVCKISFKMKQNYVVPFNWDVLEVKSYFTVSNRYLYVRNLLNHPSTGKKKHAIFIISGIQQNNPYFVEELTPITDWKTSYIESSTEGDLKLYHQIDSSAIKKISIEQRQYPFLVKSISLSQDLPRYSHIQKMGSSYPIFVTQINAISYTNKTQFSWGLSHSEYVINAISENSKCMIVTNQKLGSEEIRVIQFGAGGVAEKPLIPLNLFTFEKLSIPSSNNVWISDDCQVFSQLEVHYRYQSSSATYEIETLPNDPAQTQKLFSSNHEFLVTNDFIYRYNPTSRLYDKIVTKTLKELKKIWYANNKLVVLAWSLPDHQSKITFEIFALSIINNTVYTQIPSNTALLMTGTTLNHPPSVSVSQDLGVIVAYGKNENNAFFTKGFKMHFKYNTAVALEFPPLFETQSKIVVSNRYIYAVNQVNRINTASKFHGGYFVNNRKLTTYFEEVYSAPSSDRLTFVRSSALGQLALLYIPTPTTGTAIAPKIYPFESKLVSKNEDISKYMILEKHKTANEWKYTIVGYKPNGSQDVLQSKVSLTVSSPDYEVKAVSKNYKCVLLYRYETDNEEVSLYNFGSGSVATLKTNILGKAAQITIANVQDPTQKYDVSDDCKSFRRGSFLYRSVDGVDFSGSPTQSYDGDAYYSSDFMYKVQHNWIQRLDTTTNQYLSLFYSTGSNTKIFNKDNSLFTISQSESNGQILTSIQVGIYDSATYITVMQTLYFYSDTTPSLTVSQNLDYFVISGLNKGVFQCEIRRISYKHKFVSVVPMVPLLTSESHISLFGRYLYARNYPSVTSPKHGLYSITNQGLVPFFESLLSTPNLPADWKKLVLVGSPNPSNILLYNFIITETSTKFAIQVTSNKFGLIANSDSSTILRVTKDSGNYLVLDKKPSLGQSVYRLLSYNTDAQTSVGNPSAFSKVQHTFNSLEYEIIATSQNLKCVMFLMSELGNESMKLVDFNTPNTATVRISNLLEGPSSLSLNSIRSSWVISDDCKSFAAGNNVYHTTNYQVYVKETINQHYQMTFSKDLLYGIGNQYGLIKYESSGTYSLNSDLDTTNMYLGNRTMLYNQNVIIFISRYQFSSPNQWNFNINYFSQVTYKSHGFDNLNHFSATQPQIVYSPNLQIILFSYIEYGGNRIVKLKRWNFEDSSGIIYYFIDSLPALLTQTQSFVYLSNKHLYVRNIQNRNGTSNKYHGLYLIRGRQLYDVFEEIIPQTSIALPWASSFIQDSDQNQVILFNEYYQKGVPNSSVQIQSKTYEYPSPDEQTRWNFDADGRLLNLYQTPNELSWMSTHQAFSDRNKFVALIFNPALTTQTGNVDLPTGPQDLKTVSMNKKCALYFAPITSKLFAYDLVSKAYNQTRNVISPTLYIGINLYTATFDVANDCFSVRINNKVLHTDPTTKAFTLDALPPSLTTLLSPVFSGDFTLLVTNDALSVFVPKNQTMTSGQYMLLRNENFYTIKNVSRFENNFVIFSQDESATAGKWNFKLQFNILNGTTAKKIAEFSGQTTGKASIYLSPRLTKIIVSGKSFNSETQPFYMAKKIIYKEQKVDDIILPSSLSSRFNSIALIDDYLFVRNLNGEIRQSGYYIIDNTLKEAFNELVGLNFLANYARTVIIPDSIKSVFLYHQFNVGNKMRIVKDKRASLAQNFNPNQARVYELQYKSSKPYISTVLGKYIAEVQVTKPGKEFKFTYVEYDPIRISPKVKSSVLTKKTNNIEKIVAVSYTMDCMITVGTSAVNIYKINGSETNAFSSPVNVFSLVNGDVQNPTIIESMTRAFKNVTVTPKCESFKFLNFFYVQDGSGSYKKSAFQPNQPSTTVFDYTSRYFVASNQVFKYNSSDYSSILLFSFSVTVSQTYSYLYVSEDESKILIISSFCTRISNEFNCRVDVVSVFSKQSDNSWVQIKGIQNVKLNAPLFLRFSPNFEFVGLFSAIKVTTPQASINSVAYFAQMNYSSNTAIPVTMPSTFSINWQNDSTLYIQLSDKYLYLFRPNIDKTERLYRFDPENSTNSKLTLVYSGQRPSFLNTNLKRMKIIEQDGKVFIVYETTPSATSAEIYQRQVVNTNATIDELKKIISPTAGIIVNGNSFSLCPLGCQQCWNNQNCLKCLPGFVFDSNFICIKCSPLCKTCLVHDTSTCLSVVDGYYKDINGQGQKCHVACEKCNGAGESACISCSVNFALFENKCLPCPENCMSCYTNTGNSITICSSCNVGYALQSSGKICRKCPLGCSSCDPLSLSLCQGCRKQYRPVYDSSNKIISCTPCSDNCVICDQNTCITCRDKFRLQGTLCVVLCQAPCKSCSSTNPNACFTCVDGYKLNGQTCVPDLECNSNKTCKTCPFEYNFRQGECLRCDGGPNCKSCSLTNIKQCVSCQKGFFLTSNSTCTPCVLGCKDCPNQLFCRQCIAGYTLSYETSQSKCFKCEKRCATCWRSPTNCLSCTEGYDRNGWNCLKKQRVNLKLQMTGSVTNFSADKYKGIEDDVIKMTGRNRSHIHIFSFVQGSIIANLIIEVDSKDQENTMISAITSAISQNPIVGGFDVISYTAVGSPATPPPTPDPNTVPGNQDNNNGDPSQNSLSETKKYDYNQIAIILGVTIPSVLSTFFFISVITFLIIYILYRKGVILCNRPARILDTANSDDGSPIGSSNLSNGSPGIVKVLEMKELDCIVEDSKMALEMPNAKQTQNIDLGQAEKSSMRRTSRRVSSMKQVKP